MHSLVKLGLRAGAGLAVLGAAPAQNLVVTPLRGEPATIRSWSIQDGRVRGSLAGTGRPWSLSLRSAWILEPQVAASPSSTLTGPFLQIRRGPRLAGKLSGGKEKELQFTLASGSSSIAMTYVQGFRTRNKPKDGADNGFDRALVRPPAEDDLLFVITPKGKIQRYRGKVVGMRDGALAVTLRGNEVALALERLYGVVFAETSGLEVQTDGVRDIAAVRQHDGQVLRGVITGAASGKPVAIRLLEGMQLEVPLGRIKDIEFSSDKLVYLSALKPASSSKTNGALARQWPIIRDKGLSGGPLRLASRKYRRGFLVVPSVKLDFELPRKFDRLVGEVGIPKSRYGSARLRVLADGEQVGAVVELVANGKPSELVRPIAGATRITLELTATDDLDVGARVILGDIRAVVDAKEK